MKNSDISGQYSRLENTTSVKGDIISEGDFRIDGVLEGSIKTKGKVVIGKEGFVNGSINCLSADVEGKIKGEEGERRGRKRGVGVECGGGRVKQEQSEGVDEKVEDEYEGKQKVDFNLNGGQRG